ncbi:hypothetical protein [uncultured Alsobacter sp.]|uniref:hypothetical protein n=1 Tax=uncultured Alsobacter sp. TaxID=1748258 RepID=UPI0025F1D68A|nr:hypothetical protein [uncultured Alsobacter sp.]
MTKRKFGVSSCVRWPRDGFLNPRLEPDPRLAGGFGFRMPDAVAPELHHVAWTGRKR